MTPAVLPEAKSTETQVRNHTTQKQRLLYQTIRAIRESADIEEIFNVATEGLRHLLQVDRIAIYCFEEDWSGRFVAESYQQGKSSLLEKQKQFPDITQNVSQCSIKMLRLETATKTTADTHLQQHSGGIFSRRGVVRICNDIYDAGFSQCYIKALDLYEARAYIIGALHSGAHLWGLLAAYESDGPRDWTEAEAELLEQVSLHLGLALQQAHSNKRIEQQTAQLKKAAERQKALASTVDKIRQSWDIQTIFDTTTQGLRELIQADRVAIYKFNPDWSGEFVAESYNLPQRSLLEKQQIFPEMRRKAIDCDAGNPDTEESTDKLTIGGTIVGSEFPDTHLQETQGGAFTAKGTVRICNDIYAAGFSDCYIDILEKYEAKAYVIGALHSGDKLWGLLAAFQSAGPRQWSSEEADLLEQVSNQLGLALNQSESVTKIQQQKDALERGAELQKALTRTIDKMRQSLDIQEVFDTATQEIRQLLRADRVAIFKLNDDWSGQFVAEAAEGKWVSILDAQSENSGVTENVSNCVSRLLHEQGPADSYLQKRGHDLFMQSEDVRSKTLCICSDIYAAGFDPCYLRTLERYEARAYMISSLYRGDQIWGLVAAYQNDKPRHWTAEETSILNQISNQLSIALKQSHTLEVVRRQAANLKKAATRQAALSKTIDRIRNSLNIDEIFSATTQEVRQLLDVERVAIYRFNEDWTGAFVADSIMDGWQPSMPSSTVIEEVFSKTDKAGNYPRNEVFVPIMQGEKMWGLLMAYQNSTPRYWDEDEIALLKQVGGQLAVAISQAELLKQTRTQTEQLNKTLQKLQQTQSRMVQGEKMAGLGQLMAGIAHEINNPISFVFSNVQPAEEYVADLIKFLKLYQSEYPEPSEAIQQASESLDIEFVAEDFPRLINSMSAGAIRIREIVESMKVFSRMDEAGIKTVDIHEGIDSTLLILAHRIKANSQRPAIELVKDYADLPPIRCYPGQLNQVFMNLLSNAIDAFSDWESEALENTRTPQIRIVTERSPQGKVIIYVIDNGSGIPEEILPNIFDPFFTTKPVGQGTGLGLSISYQIVTEIHGGTLECQSGSKGSIFRIELPITYRYP